MFSALSVPFFPRAIHVKRLLLGTSKMLLLCWYLSLPLLAGAVA